MLFVIIGFFTGVTLHNITPYDAECRPWQSGPIFVTHAVVDQSCAPGGPCRRRVSADLPADAVRLQLKGCTVPQAARFEATAKTCEGATLLRYTGKTPQVGQFSLLGDGTQIGYLGKTGVPQGLECPGVEGPLMQTSIQHPDRSLWGTQSFEAFRDPREFSVVDLRQGRYRLTWRQLNTVGGETPEGIVVADSEDVLRDAERNDAGHIKVVGRAQTTEVQMARKGGLCLSRSTITSQLRISGTALVLKTQRTLIHVLEPQLCKVFKAPNRPVIR